MADDDKPKQQMASDGSIRSATGQFVSKKDLASALKESNKETNKDSREANATAKKDLEATIANKDQLIQNGIQAGLLAKKKEQVDGIIKAQIDKQTRIQSGEYGFKGLFKNAKDNIKGQLMMDKTFSEGFAEVGDALAGDLQFLGQMLSPLTAIPGVSTALTGLKFVAGQTLKLGTKEGREAAKDYIRAKKEWVQKKAHNAWIKMATTRDWMLAKKKWVWEKIQAAKAKIKERGGALKEKLGGMKDSAKGPANKILMLVKKLLTGIGVVIVGIIVFVASFFKSIGAQLGKILAGPWNKVKAFFGKWKMPKFLTTAINYVKNIFGKGGALGGAFQKIKNLFTPVQKAISTLMKSPVVQFMGKLGATLGKFFIPLTILMAAWQSIKGLIDGWKNTQGTWGDKIIGGLAGITESLINFFIMMPLDLIKDMLAWLGEKLGLIGPDTKKMINEFSFAELFSTMFEGLVNMGLAIKNWVAAVLAGAWAGIKAAWPGGESPMGAFKKAYNAKIASGGGTYKGSMSGDKATGSMIEEASDENKRAEDEKTSTQMGPPRPETGPNVISQNTNINQASKNITVKPNGPSDFWGGQFATGEQF
tara:strand:+ start:15896 stop:17671 length:1776 start_codon:yes stop_codon:yes gene_type:complete